MMKTSGSQNNYMVFFSFFLYIFKGCPKNFWKDTLYKSFLRQKVKINATVLITHAKATKVSDHKIVRHLIIYRKKQDTHTTNSYLVGSYTYA